MRSEYIFPSVLIALDVAAALRARLAGQEGAWIHYGVCGNCGARGPTPNPDGSFSI